MTVALAMKAAIGDVSRFDDQQRFVSYLGLNPSDRQSGLGPAYHRRPSRAVVMRWAYSSRPPGSSARLGRISKQGDPYLRRLLMVGAHAVLRFSAKSKVASTRWATERLAKKPYNVVADALSEHMMAVAQDSEIGGADGVVGERSSRGRTNPLSGSRFKAR